MSSSRFARIVQLGDQLRRVSRPIYSTGRDTARRAQLARLNRTATGIGMTQIGRTFRTATTGGLVLLSGLFFVHAKESDAAERERIMTEADRLFDEDKFTELKSLLRSQMSWYDDSECLWRMARCEYHISKYCENNEEKNKLVESAYEHVKKSLELDGACGPAHKWAAILLDAHSSNLGTKERVRNILQVRHHMEQSIRFSPTDATAHYLLGEWHFGCFQVTWIERKLANMFFGRLPDADMEVALKMFEIAETLEPNFYSKNKTLLAKTLVQLGREPERVKAICLDVVDKYSESAKWDDQEAVKEATGILKKMGVQVDLKK